MIYKIAIDGPSSTGKSVTARQVAKKLSIVYVDTGAMYRAVGYYLLDKNLDYNNEEIVNKELKNIEIELNYVEGNQRILLNGQDISEEIRTKEISNIASIISTYEKVRKYLVHLQQKLAKKTSVIMDGRDIASVVLPDADLKIYLECEVNERARRRREEYLKKGVKNTIKEVKKELLDRDYRDLTREHSPLVKVPGAIEIDTTKMTKEEVTDEIIRLLKEKVNI